MRLAALAIVVAQLYSPAPQPATTSVPALHAQAVMRAVVERFHRGIGALDKHDWKHASAEFGAIIALNPPEPQGSTAAYDLGVAQAHLGENDDAAKSFRAAIAKDPGFLAAMANLVATDLRRNDIVEARSVSERFVALAPDSARAHYSRGLAAMASSDYAVARDDFSQLLKSDPRYAVAQYDLGVAETHLGNYAAAETDFTAALALAPGYARARFALGTVLLHRGAKADARQAFDRAARDATDDPSLRGLATQMRDAIALNS